MRTLETAKIGDVVPHNVSPDRIGFRGMFWVAAPVGDEYIVDKRGVLTKSNPSYLDWAYTELPVKRGVNFCSFVPRNCWLVARVTRVPVPKWSYIVPLDKGIKRKSRDFPVGDTRYFGIRYHRNKRWLEYCCSHEGSTKHLLKYRSAKEATKIIEYIRCNQTDLDAYDTLLLRFVAGYFLAYSSPGKPGSGSSLSR